jgi:LysR family glycine cleavage system transcriptional activator
MQTTLLSERRLPSLNAVRSFEAAARHLSFTLAARELCVTQGAVSRIVQALESELGVALFRRIGRNLELTPAGAASIRTSWKRSIALLPPRAPFGR